MAAPASEAAVKATENAPDLVNPAGAFPPFDSHTFVDQLVWLVVVFGLLYYLMSRIALPRVGGILEARSARIAGDLADANRMQRQAAEASAAYDAKLAQAKAGAQALARDTHNKLLAESEGKRHALEAALNGRLATAEAQIRDTKTKALANVEGIARDAAATIVEHLTGKAPTGSAIDAAVAAVKPNRSA